MPSTTKTARVVLSRHELDTLQADAEAYAAAAGALIAAYHAVSFNDRRLERLAEEMWEHVARLEQQVDDAETAGMAA
jgi:hypothetical protein